MSNILRKQNQMIDMTPPSDAYDVTYGNSTVGDELDRLQIKSVTVTGTTDSYGRLNIPPLTSMNVAILWATTINNSYIFVPYVFITTVGGKSYYLQVRRSDTTSYTPITSTSVTVTVYFIELP